MLAGLVGPQTSLKAIHAALACKGGVSIFPELPSGPNRYKLLYDSAGYERYLCKIDYGVWQMYLVSRCKGFLPNMSRVALWRVLSSTQYTTPLLRRWMPWIEQELISRELLVPLSCFNCKCGWLTATNDDLDKVVSHGLSTKELVIA